MTHPLSQKRRSVRGALRDLESCMREKEGSGLHVPDSSVQTTSVALIRRKKLPFWRRSRTKNDKRFRSLRWTPWRVDGECLEMTPPQRSKKCRHSRSRQQYLADFQKRRVSLTQKPTKIGPSSWTIATKMRDVRRKIFLDRSERWTSTK